MGRKRWTIERFSIDIVSDLASAQKKFSGLSLRDATILASSNIDLGLAELIEKRLCGTDNAKVEFLGADEDGRAPCGSFGARIQLAYLLGIITEDDVELLRNLKKLRNLVAHRSLIDIGQPKIQVAMTAIWSKFNPVVYKLLLILVRVVQKDPKIWRQVEESGKKQQIEEGIDKLNELRPAFEQSIKPLLVTWKLDNHKPLVGLWAMISVLLPKSSEASVIALGLIAVVYQSRFELFLKSIHSIDRVKLPKDSEKMWDKDLVADE